MTAEEFISRYGVTLGDDVTVMDDMDYVDRDDVDGTLVRIYTYELKYRGRVCCADWYGPFEREGIAGAPPLPILLRAASRAVAVKGLTLYQARELAEWRSLDERRYGCLQDDCDDTRGALKAWMADPLMWRDFCTLAYG